MYKKYGKSLITTLLYCLFLIHTSSTFAQTYGLKFNGRDVTLDKRTELNLNPKGFFKFQDEFEISFDYKITRISPYSNEGFFGYIFRIINQEDCNIDLLSTPTPAIGLNLVLGKSKEVVPIIFPQEAINNWYRLRIKFLQNEDKLIFYTPDTFYIQNNVGFKKNESIKIIFGANDYKQFNNSDVPTMSVKDIEIFENGKLRFSWPLNEKEGYVATDKIKGKKAAVINPSWIVPNHYSWERIYEDEVVNVVTVAADTEGGKIFIICKTGITIYDTRKNNITKIKYNKIPTFPAENYRAIYNTLDNHVYCYLVDKAPYYRINIETGALEEIGFSSNIRSRFIQHNSYFNASANDIYLFGGYGLHRYENSIRRLDLTNQVWKNLSTNDTIFPPRYLAGLGSLNDTIYILGGYGSESGNQIINPQNYYDLFGYSIKDSSLFSKFNIPQLMKNMVLGNTMWIDKNNRDYYALVFNKLIFDNEIALIKGNLDSPKIEFIGDKIPFKFLDIHSFAGLYYMPQQNKIFAYTSFSNDSTTEIAIHSIDNPPIASSKIQMLTGKKIVYFIIIGIIFLLIVFIIWIVLRKRKARIKLNSVIQGNQLQPGISSIEAAEKPMNKDNNYNLIFFGGFQVFDKEWVDITNKFSPLLKELFLLILLHTFKNNKGISSKKITEVLWYDKSEKKALNNLAVNIRKLRSILEEIGTCELSKKTGYWKISFKNSEVKSDYVDFLYIATTKINLTKQKVNQLIEITEKGAFLSNVEYEWLDEFKALVSDSTIDSLVHFANSIDIKKEAEFVIHLADSIFNFDITNEDAMILKCKAQYCMGKHSHAKATYEKFFKEYLQMYGQEYERAFLDILEIKE